MASSKDNNITKILILFIFLYEHSDLVQSDVIPDRIKVKQWSDSLSQKLTKSLQHYYTVLNPNVDDSKLQQYSLSVDFEVVDAETIVQKFAAELSTMLSKKMDALKESVSKAEKAAMNHKWKTSISAEEQQELLAPKDIMWNDSRLEYNDRFKQKVIGNMTSVHIPVEIYSGDIQILNGLQWSKLLDEVFHENYKADNEMLWQYFGSQTGFMRTHPASVWNTGDEVDLYDVRRRPWYTQGSSSPKDMLILIDTSGSVHGQALELIKVAVKSLLDTLGENDFVNIASFSEEATSVSECFKGKFVQASYRNKQKLIEEVDKISAQMMADFVKGFTFAFEQFEMLKNQTNGQRGAECNRMIMLLTDGGTENAEDIFKKYNPAGNQTYRVFTYAVGPTANPVSAIRWMACANRGYFSQIPAMGAVRSKVQEYVDVISRPLALKGPSEYHWTSIYRSSYQPAGLGMMTTVTLPVYNKSTTKANQTILGVMGIDITTDAMLKYAPLRKMGPNGFPFAVNANGYIVFHPNLKIQPDLRDPPNVDLLEVEVENPAKLQMRDNMVDQKAGTFTTDTLTMSNDGRHVDIETGEKQRTYSYTPIDKTTFSVGVSIPEYHKHHMKVNINSLDVALNAFLTDSPDQPNLFNLSFVSMLIPDWEFYENYTAGNITGTIRDLQEAMENNPDLKWDEELLAHLLLDMFFGHNLEPYWRLNSPGVFSRPPVSSFLSTVGGLTMLYPKSEELIDRFYDQRDTWKASYFKRAIDSTDIILSAPFIVDKNNGTVGDITVMQSYSMTSGNPSFGYRGGVLGAVYSHDVFEEILLTLPANGAGWNDVANCGQPDELACHLLDDGGFLVATNQPRLNTSVGRFFGKVDPEIMKDMVNQSFFGRLEQYEYKATCLVKEEDGTTSAGNLNIPALTLLYEMLTFNWWSSVVTWTFTNFNLYNMLYTSPDNFVSAEKHYMHPKTEECDRKKAQYYLNGMESIESLVECHVRNLNCSREYIAQRVPGTNLLLVVSETEKEDCEVCSQLVEQLDLIQELTKIPKEESDAHFCSLEPRHRRKTSACYDHDPREDDSKCSASLSRPLSVVVISLVAMVIQVLVNG